MTFSQRFARNGAWSKRLSGTASAEPSGQGASGEMPDVPLVEDESGSGVTSSLLQKRKRGWSQLTPPAVLTCLGRMSLSALAIGKRMEAAATIPHYRALAQHQSGSTSLQGCAPIQPIATAGQVECYSLSNTTPASVHSVQGSLASDELCDPSRGMTPALIAVKSRVLDFITDTLNNLNHPERPLSEQISRVEAAHEEITGLFERLFLTQEQIKVQVQEECMEEARQEMIAKVSAVLLL